jgi:hypothetical protein
MDYGQTNTEDDGAKLVTPPHPSGMSGGRMWRVAQHDCDMAKWTLADVRLIEIQSAYYTEQIISCCEARGSIARSALFTAVVRVCAENSTAGSGRKHCGGGCTKRATRRFRAELG